MLIVRSLAFNTLFYLVTAIIATVGLPVLVSKRATIRYARFWGQTMVWLLRVVGGTRIDYRGLDHLPQGPILVAAKHQSTLETLALLLPFERFAYVLKRELMWLPLIGWYFARAGMVAIDRSKGARTMAGMNEAARTAIAEGRQLIVFPEGTRRPAGAPPAYKQGLSHLYANLGVPCLPIALNTGLFWPRHGFRRLPGTTVIEMLPPIAPGLPRQAFHSEIQTRIENASNLLLAEGRAELCARGLPGPTPGEAGAAKEPSGAI